MTILSILARNFTLHTNKFRCLWISRLLFTRSTFVENANLPITLISYRARPLPSTFSVEAAVYRAKIPRDSFLRLTNLAQPKRRKIPRSHIEVNVCPAVIDICRDFINWTRPIASKNRMPTTLSACNKLIRICVVTLLGKLSCPNNQDSALTWIVQ